ncbi:MAG TPA: zinc-ribbon domain-containing protein [Blastocatellia bacterium]|nr:zinc-ribbon domain-containing protein [Blastocatellia bacterium]
MYCPTCATQNSDGTKYCRACGTNLSLVPQAITGRLPEAPRGRRHRGGGLVRGGPPGLAGGITSVFMGLGFVMVALALAVSGSGRGWWFWMLIPAFSLLGKGVANIVTTLQAQRANPGPTYTAMPPAVNTTGLPPQPDFETLPPPSVTETTTRHLDAKTDNYNERR